MRVFVVESFVFFQVRLVRRLRPVRFLTLGDLSDLRSIRLNLRSVSVTVLWVCPSRVQFF